MTKAIITTEHNKGQYVKADRSKKTSYPICIKSERNGKLYWVKVEDIVSVENNNIKMSGERFCSLLQIS